RAQSPDWPTSPFGQTYDKDIMGRVRTLAHMADLNSGRFGPTCTPRQLKWGNSEASLEDILCHGGHPVIVMLVGEVESTSFYNEYNKPEKFVHISIKPLYRADLVAAQNMLRTYCEKVKARLPAPGVVEAARRQTRKSHTSRGTEVYEFKHAYDASNKYGPKSTMPALSPSDIGYCNLVLVECKLVRFRVDQESGKATYYVYDWVSWRCRFDIVSICRIQVGDDGVSSDVADEEDVPVV
ncbi:hypothetical protein C8Q78DRAFT_934209, partial [Trametes maxima]